MTTRERESERRPGQTDRQPALETDEAKTRDPDLGPLTQESAMRFTFDSGEQVGHGFYLGLNHLEQVAVGREGRALPGERGVKWLRIPWLAVLATAPIIGFLFVVFMPVIGIALVLKVVAEAAIRETYKLVRPAAATPAAPALLGQTLQPAHTPAAPTTAKHDSDGTHRPSDW
jgi:hypothetical protein